jgi:hypothetical protein
VGEKVEKVEKVETRKIKLVTGKKYSHINKTK